MSKNALFGWVFLSMVSGVLGCSGVDDASPSGMGSRPNGAMCDAAGQCVSGLCGTGVCQSTAGGSGRANGVMCAAPSDCASGFCIASVCQATPNNDTMGDRPVGALCTRADLCASNTCVDGMCRSPDVLDAGGDATTDARNDRPDRADVDDVDDAEDVPMTTDATSDGATTPDPTTPPRIVNEMNGENCDDTLDNDLDGVVNEDCACNPGARSPCYPGRPDEAGGTRCQFGTMTCLSTARWSECTGFGRPETETCNGTDDNCDGQIDEECECPTEGMSRMCFAGPAGTSGVGVCRSGLQRCARDMVGRLFWGDCEGMIVPDFESCNRMDDDCDGEIDEGCECALGATRDCYAGSTGTQNVGVCRGGTQRCLTRGDGGSTWSACSGSVTPTPETCNGVDDNCDGTLDEGCMCTAGGSQECYNGPPGTRGRGVCAAGRATCADAMWGTCGGQRLPSGELCGNRVDDDCDGQVDEGCLCMAGETPTFRRLNPTPMAATCGVQAGPGGHSMPMTCESGRSCPEGQVFVEARRGSFQCVDAPPTCPPDRFATWYLASGWVCDRGCEVLVRSGGSFGDRVMCAQRPAETMCGPSSCFRVFNPELEAWECGSRCAGGRAAVRISGLLLCVPCPDPPGAIRPRD